MLAHMMGGANPSIAFLCLHSDCPCRGVNKIVCVCVGGGAVRKNPYPNNVSFWLNLMWSVINSIWTDV